MDMFSNDWWLPPARSELIEAIIAQLSLSRSIATILVNRRLENVQKALSFLHPELEHLHDPFTLPDMEAAVHRIMRAVNEKEPIVIYGHDDVDGMTSAFVLFEVIRDMKGLVSTYIPNRIAEGVGLSSDNLSLLAKGGAKLIITVDCGIEDRLITENGHRLPADIIVADHHEVHDTIPVSIPFVNPKRSDSSYRFRDLAGVGVSFKLAQALLLKRKKPLRPFFYAVGDLITLGTLADKVPLVDENRVFTRLGFDLMRASLRPGLRAIMNRFDETQTIQTGFVIRRMIPILSSAHSIKGQNAAFTLLQTEDRKKAAQLTEELLRESQEWQQTLLESYQRILECVERNPPGRMIFVIDDRTPPGVLGASASKLMREHQCPAIILSFREDRYTGEGRAPKGVDLVDLLSQCRDLLINFGGHKQAAGFSIFPEYIEDFQERMTELVEAMFSPYTPSRRLDSEIDLDALDQRFFEEFDFLAPFGRENPNPFFLSRGVSITPTTPEKRDEQYVCIGIVRTFPLITSVQQDIYRKIKEHPSENFDIVFQIVTSYGNTPHILLKDLRKTE